MNLFTPFILLGSVVLLGAGGCGLMLAALTRRWWQRLLWLGLSAASWGGLAVLWNSLSDFTLD